MMKIKGVLVCFLFYFSFVCDVLSSRGCVRIRRIVWGELQHISEHRRDGCMLATFVSIRFAFLALSLAIKQLRFHIVFSRAFVPVFTVHLYTWFSCSRARVSLTKSNTVYLRSFQSNNSSFICSVCETNRPCAIQTCQAISGESSCPSAYYSQWAHYDFSSATND